MKVQKLTESDKSEIKELFTSVFEESEGGSEGSLIGSLSYELALFIDNYEVFCFGVFDGDTLIGSIFFTRLDFLKSKSIYMLAPVAVRSEYQGKGVGQRIINDGLDMIKNMSVDTIVTYGDPQFYSKVGFKPLDEKVIKAPLRLSMPEGWQGQSLNGDLIEPREERPTCVEAFYNPVYW